MSKRFVLPAAGFLLVLGGLALASCGGSSSVSIAEARSGLPRVTDAPPPADLAVLVEGNTAFAFDLYRVLRGGDANLFFSPYSISAALAMAYAGARGETGAEMAAALHFALHQDRLHRSFNGLDRLLTGRGKDARGRDGQPFRLHVVNAAWGQSGFPFLPAYLDVLAQEYGAGMRLVDFAADPDAVRKTINGWVEQQTEKRIQDLLPEGSIDAMTRLVLTNAIYFNAAWQHVFDEARTTTAPFHLLGGGTIDAQLMRQSESLRYGSGAGYQAVEIPYSGGELSMVVILPPQGQFAAFEGSLDAARFRAIVDGLRPAQVILGLPKFEVKQPIDLNGPLATLGMAKAFQPAEADFSGMDGSRDLYISQVLHQSFVKVDEKGTEAAAATAVVIRVTSAPGEVVEMIVDRPFIFAIRDIETGAVLFLGRVSDPS
jgi:serpin B